MTRNEHQCGFYLVYRLLPCVTIPRLQPLSLFVCEFLIGLTAVLGCDVDVTDIGERGIRIVVRLNTRVNGASLRWNQLSWMDSTFVYSRLWDDGHPYGYL